MPKRRYRDSEEESSSIESSDYSSDSDYDSKYKKKKKRHKKSRHHSKEKDRERRKRRRKKKEKKSKHRKKSKSKSNSKRKRRDEDDEEIEEPKHKKRKIDPCTKKEMIKNAKTVLKMFCDDDDMKQFIKDILTKLDNNEYISISDQILIYQQPLKMLFTFLQLDTSNNIIYHKPDPSASLLSMFAKELQIETQIKPKTTAFIGPAMPPNFNNKQTKNKNNVVGPTMPSKQDLLNNTYSSEDDQDDDYGPALLKDDDKSNYIESKRLLQMQHTKIYTEMQKQIESAQCGNSANINNDDDNKREEWMTSMPDSFMSDFKKGTMARTFNTKQHEQDSSWTETPNDLKIQKKLNKKIKKIQNVANEKLKLFGLPSIKQKQQTLTESDNDNDKNINNINNELQPQKSLFEIHQEKLRKEYKMELKEWKKKKKKGKNPGPKPVFKGVDKEDGNTNYTGSMESYYSAQNPTFTRSKLNTFVSGGTI